MRLSRHSILLLAALLLCLALSSARAAGIQAEVKVSRMSVYAQTSPYGYIGSLPKGTVVTVDSYSEKAALIRWNGYVGLASVRDLQPLSGGESAAQAQRDVITLRETAVYKKPSTSSACVTLPAGTALKLLETRGSYAPSRRNPRSRPRLSSSTPACPSTPPSRPASTGRRAPPPAMIHWKRARR